MALLFSSVITEFGLDKQLIFLSKNYSKQRLFKIFSALLIIIVFSCKSDDSTLPMEIDFDGDGVMDDQEILDGTNKNNPCDPIRSSGYAGYDIKNTVWSTADCDGDGINNADELENSTDPYFSDTQDTDGDGIADSQEIINGTSENDPCDPVQNPGYIGFNVLNVIWTAADCDGDGISNADEIVNSTDPYFDDTLDTDGDGIPDTQEVSDNTDQNDPCDPVQSEGYEGYDMLNAVWMDADCDGDGVNNGDEIIADTDPYNDDTVYAIPEFLQKLSELQLFDGNLSDLKFNKTVHEYSLSTPLFTDYSYKLRSIAIPKGEQMVYNGEGLLLFPDNSVITKTFYYFNDERDPSLGKRIIETRVLIKKNGNWQVGNYFWNDEQTEAFLDQAPHTVQINWIDNLGADRMVNYEVPSRNQCFQCHDNYGITLPIGPKARALNFVYNGNNQIQYLVNNELLNGAPDVSQIESLPDWSDESLSLEERARAYLDVNCAHCHQPGGFYNIGSGDTFELRFETSFDDSNIYDQRINIQNRIISDFPNYGMPFIGTTVIHAEGVSLINDYIDSLN